MARKPLVLQSLVFRNDQWSLAKAKRWLREHGHFGVDPDILARTTRFLQRSPRDFIPDTFRTVTLANGVLVVSGHLKR